MVSTTAERLVRFAKENNIWIAPFRDPEEWAREINENDGKCLCDPSRTCPCPQSVVEIKNAKTPDEATCLCVFYCSDGYIEWYKKTMMVEDDKITSRAEEVEKKLNEEKEKEEKGEYEEIDIRRIRNQMVRDLLMTFTKIKVAVRNSDYESAYEYIEIEKERNTCGICRNYMEEIKKRIEVINDVEKWEPDRRVLKNEKENLEKRINYLMNLYYKVDEEMSSLSTTNIEGESNPYHGCLSTLLKDREVISDINKIEPDRKTQFAIITAWCANKGMTFDEAIRMVESARKKKR